MVEATKRRGNFSKLSCAFSKPSSSYTRIVSTTSDYKAQFMRSFATAPPSASTARPVKTPDDSRIEKRIDLSKNNKLRELFINNWGEVRIGLILEELDRVAGAVSYKHALGTNTEVVGLLEAVPAGETPNFSHRPESASTMDTIPMVVVTAGVDSIILYRPLVIKNDLRILGRVVLAGRSSMEVLLEVDSVVVDPATGTEKFERAIEAHFTMVARSTDGQKSVTVPDLQPSNDEEWACYKRAQEGRSKRKASIQSSIFTTIPKPEEHELLHKLFYNIESRNNVDAITSEKQFIAAPSQAGATNAAAVSTPDSKATASLKKAHVLLDKHDQVPGIHMQNTFRSSVFVMQPQKRNIHNKVFGGYLMRLAFEQAWCSAYIFSGALPSFIACDDISFLLPVSLGTLVTFDGTLVYSRPIEDGRFELVVEVKANVLHPNEHTHETTNTFFFFFRVPRCDLQVIPTTYQESMKWLDGKRRLESITQQRDSTRSTNEWHRAL